jgi:hypothetical protein
LPVVPVTQGISRTSDVGMPVMDSSTAEIQAGPNPSRSGIPTDVRGGPGRKAIQ